MYLTYIDHTVHQNIFMKGDLIVRSGDRAGMMAFVSRGVVATMTPDDPHKVG